MNTLDDAGQCPVAHFYACLEAVVELTQALLVGVAGLFSPLAHRGRMVEEGPKSVNYPEPAFIEI
jgi:hypothetical protein